jgi:hypothetical protein
MYNKHENVFPSIDHMADKIGCNEKTVRRALDFFKQHEWLGWIKRGYISNQYFLNDELAAIDLKSASTWEKPQNVHRNVHVLGILPDSVNVHCISPEEIPPKEPSASGSALIESEVLSAAPGCIKIQTLTIPEIASLTRDYSEFELNKAVEDGRWYAKQGHKIASMFGYLVSRANACRRKYRAC